MLLDTFFVNETILGVCVGGGGDGATGFRNS